MNVRPLAPVDAVLEDLRRATDLELRAVWSHLERMAEDADRAACPGAAALCRSLVVLCMAEAYDRETVGQQVDQVLRDSMGGSDDQRP